MDGDVEADIDRVRRTGQPVPTEMRSAGEWTVGTSLGRVRIHHDARADALSRSLQAKAFTTGTDIFFRKGAYDPSTMSGREVLAHELAHVSQQGGTVHRRLDFDGTRLDGLTSLTALLQTSTLTQIVQAYKEYSTVANSDLVYERNLLNHIEKLIGEWLDSHTKKEKKPKDESAAGAKPGHSAKVAPRKRFGMAGSAQADVSAFSKDDAPKAKILNDLHVAILNEKAKLGIRGLGIAADLADELGPGGARHVLAADSALSRGDVAAADGEIAQLRTAVGNGADLVKGTLMRKHIGQISPGVAQMLAPAFGLTDT
ncbi:MAG: DUF4157 domain-containing protein, partial [Actinobacteria bacterium]|nr:DUF4157 domain-containing protein [Actinomycetota bacterium]